jgi:hypothetical protein
MIRKTILVALAMQLLSACVIPTGPVDVTRFHRGTEGFVFGSGSYVVTTQADTLAMSPYLAAVSREMQRVGYNEDMTDSDVIAEVKVDVVKREANGRSPVSVGVGGSTGSYGSGVGVGVGFNLGAASNARVETTLSVRLLRRSDSLVIWEGRASQSAGVKSPAAQPGIAASKLASALFQDFPGESGTTISVP